MRKIGFFASIALALVLITPVMATDAVGISGVEYHTKDEILTMYQSLDLDQTVNAAFDVNPDISGITTSGVLADVVLQNALDTLNFVRYIAGLSYDVTLNDTYVQNSQNGAFALALLGGSPEHYISQPSGMSDSMYDSAYLGTSQANLSSGRDNLSENIINGWLADESDSNISTVGHRRWILTPNMTEVGFGVVFADSSAKYDVYTSMSTQGTDIGGDAVGVIWPAQNMPVEYFDDNYPWSYTANKALAGETTVTITREGDGASWTIKDDFINGATGDGFIAINNDYYGQPGCIIFRPDNITYSAGDVYHVQISGSTTASYTVNFFSLSDSYTPQEVVTVPTDTTIEDTTEEIVPQETPDLSKASSWAQAELQEAVDSGFPVDIYSDKFEQAMTRGEFAHMLGLFCDIKWAMTGDYSQTDFTDLGTDPANTERNKYIIALNQWGVINGTSDTTFDPDATITREAIAKLLLGVENLYQVVNVTQDIGGYADANSVSDWALEGVRYMNQKGVLNGTSENLLNPQGNVTVQEAALMCYRLFK